MALARYRRAAVTTKRYFCISGHALRVPGQEDAADLRAPLRASGGNELLNQANDKAIFAQTQAP